MNRRKLFMLVLAVVGVVWFVRGGGPDATQGHRQRAANVVVAYTAKWCYKCQLDKPHLAELRAQGWTVQEIDVDAAGLHMGIPWYRVFKNGSPVFQTDNILEIQ